MPTYTYKCSKCEHGFEKLLSIAARIQPTIDPCPNCGQISVDKLIDGVGLVQWETNLRPDDTFTDILKQVQKKNKGSTMDEKFYK
jgi:putative FmdB family regulatory protein